MTFFEILVIEVISQKNCIFMLKDNIFKFHLSLDITSIQLFKLLALEIFNFFLSFIFPRPSPKAGKPKVVH